ncbi:MAG TPA: TlpA disulfide reductase family protein [Ktedonobacteraceae bacterium]
MAEKKKTEKKQNTPEKEQVKAVVATAGSGNKKSTPAKEGEKSVEAAAKAEQRLAREQRQELKDELAENFAQRPRIARHRQRVITFSVLGVIALFAMLFIIFVLLPASPQVPHGGVAVGQKAPEFTLPVQGGAGAGTISLAGLRGQPVVLNFWSVTCPPCNAEVPYLRGLYRNYSGTGAFTLLGIDQADPSVDIQSFGQRFQVNYALLLDANSSVNMLYGVTSLPQTYFIDSAGIVRYVVAQQLTPQAMQQGLQAIGVSKTILVRSSGIAQGARAA